MCDILIFFSSPGLKEEKVLAKVSLNNVVCAVGGYTNGFECFTNTEMLNIDYGRWINVHSNLDKVN
jgi:hypothetical protein